MVGKRINGDGIERRERGNVKRLSGEYLVNVFLEVESETKIPWGGLSHRLKHKHYNTRIYQRGFKIFEVQGGQHLDKDQDE